MLLLHQVIQSLPISCMVCFQKKFVELILLFSNYNAYERINCTGFNYVLKYISALESQLMNSVLIFDNERHLENYCAKVFCEVKVGRVTERLFMMTVDQLIALCAK